MKARLLIGVAGLLNIAFLLAVPAYADRVVVMCKPVMVPALDCSTGTALRTGRMPLECRTS